MRNKMSKRPQHRDRSRIHNRFFHPDRPAGDRAGFGRPMAVRNVQEDPVHDASRICRYTLGGIAFQIIT